MSPLRNTCPTYAGNLDRANREPISHDAKLIGLVGGQHESVIETDRTLIYCSVNKEFRPGRRRCDHCPMRNEAL